MPRQCVGAGHDELPFAPHQRGDSLSPSPAQPRLPPAKTRYPILGNQRDSAEAVLERAWGLSLGEMEGEGDARASRRVPRRLVRPFRDERLDYRKEVRVEARRLRAASPVSGLAEGDRRASRSGGALRLRPPPPGWEGVDAGGVDGTCPGPEGGAGGSSPTCPCPRIGPPCG